MKQLGGDESGTRSRDRPAAPPGGARSQAARITGPVRGRELRAEEARLSGAAVSGGGGKRHSRIWTRRTGAFWTASVGRSQAWTGARSLEELRDRARGLQAEAADLASELRVVVETWEDDPERWQPSRRGGPGSRTCAASTAPPSKR